jgi:hypothetical protein
MHKKPGSSGGRKGHRNQGHALDLGTTTTRRYPNDSGTERWSRASQLTSVLSNPNWGWYEDQWDPKIRQGRTVVQWRSRQSPALDLALHPRNKLRPIYDLLLLAGATPADRHRIGLDLALPDYRHVGDLVHLGIADPV